MTKLLEKAFAEAAKLDASQQNALAEWLLKELDGEREWDATLARSADTLVAHANDAVADYRAGRTKPLLLQG